ncbi:MAG: AAA family ATPase [Saprospiraceae bacterium]
MNIIGISGRSGSGKTSVIKQIRAEFSEEDVCIISLDNYYRNRHDQEIDALGYYNFDLMSSFKWDRVVADIKKLKTGKNVLKKQYAFNNEDDPITNTYKPSKVLIVEGIFVLAEPNIWDLLDCSIIIDANIETCRNRRLTRDVNERNYDRNEILHRFDNHVLPSFKKLIDPLKPKVNFVLLNEGKLDDVKKKLMEIILSFLKP